VRRTPTIWVPSWQTPCGVAEYTRHLTSTIADVDVARRPPDLRGPLLLHVQHEHSLFDERELAATLRRARRRRLPVVVTEHTVCAEAAAWERDAAALVALTDSGAQRLRARWPGKRVEHIAHGCPTWFPPRKRTRGRVIGAFGFLEPYKGFGQLLEALRALPGTELLLVSHARHADHEAQWTELAAGLPVRRHSGFLPVEEAARLLAAEADVLVYWYDERVNVSASGAARVGLATGVPVLASPTTWFADLRRATYQPTDLVEGVRRLLEDDELRERVAGGAREHCHQHSWARSAERHLALWESIEDAGWAVPPRRNRLARACAALCYSLRRGEAGQAC
jgi:glycosyltransferase involved in cell wall biosynthesis